MVKDSSSGIKEKSIKAAGLMVRCMDTASTLGKMEENTAVNITKTKNMAMENTFGQMANVSKDNGSMGSELAKEN